MEVGREERKLRHFLRELKLLKSSLKLFKRVMQGNFFTHAHVSW